MSDYLKVVNLNVSYGHVAALRGVSLSCGERQVIALIGSNGAGKTTVLRAMTGLSPIASGEIWFDGAGSTGWKRMGSSPAASPWCRRADASSRS